MAKGYEIVTTTPTDQDDFLIETAVFDTGAGAKWIREDVIATLQLAKVEPDPATTKAAGDTTFTVEGVVRL